MDTPQIKPSFFDEAPSADYIIWKKGVPVKKSSEHRLMEGILFKRSSGTNFWKSRYYVLFEDRLAYYKNGREAQQEAYCNVQNMRIEKIYLQQEKDEKFGLRLIHNNAYFEIYARSKDVQEKWLAALSRFCVLTSYSSSFVNIKVIGKGSFARVFLSKRRNNGMHIAVKTFDKNLLFSVEKAKASLINEINIMRRLEHDNIINLFEVYESDNHIYLILELLNGGELFDRIVRKGQYNERDACILMRNLLSAVAYMHSKGIMHRDIKPENLILKDLQNDWDVKIADFGLATAINSGEQLFKRCGTPGYVAPEILADEKYDEKVDVFSCGVILYILLTGGSPFHANSYTEILMKNKDCNINFNFWEFGQQFSDAAVDLLMRMLQKDPAERISAEDALKHPWILSGGVFMTPSMHPIYLNYAQDNMRRFQEEQQYHMAMINAHCQDPSALQRSSHAPGQLINGRMVTVADSYNHFYLNSPDIRKQGNMMPNQNYAGQVCCSPQIGTSLASTNDETNEQGQLSHELNLLNLNLNGYHNENMLLSQFTGVDQSNVSSGKNTPMMKGKKPCNQQADMKKVMNVQDALLKYISVQAAQQRVQSEQNNNTNNLIDNVQLTQY